MDLRARIQSWPFRPSLIQATTFVRQDGRKVTLEIRRDDLLSEA